MLSRGDGFYPRAYDLPRLPRLQSTLEEGDDQSDDDDDAVGDAETEDEERAKQRSDGGAGCVVLTTAADVELVFGAKRSRQGVDVTSEDRARVMASGGLTFNTEDSDHGDGDGDGDSDSDSNDDDGDNDDGEAAAAPETQQRPPQRSDEDHQAEAGRPPPWLSATSFSRPLARLGFRPTFNDPASEVKQVLVTTGNGRFWAVLDRRVLLWAWRMFQRRLAPYLVNSAEQQQRWLKQRPTATPLRLTKDFRWDELSAEISEVDGSTPVALASHKSGTPHPIMVRFSASYVCC